VWFGEGADSAGYEVPFTSLTMHAVSRGAEDGSNDFTSPCIYAQVEGTPPEGFGATIAIGGDGPGPEDVDEGDEEDDDEGDDEDDAGGFAMGGGDDGDYDDMFELRIVPKDSEGLDQMFHVLCECAAMNPDDDEDEEEDDGGLFFDEDEVMRGAGADGRAAALERFDAMLQIDPGVDELIRDDPGRFEDEEEEEEEGK
jgi:nucleotide-sensitive chloride channel 1A